VHAQRGQPGQGHRARQSHRSRQNDIIEVSIEDKDAPGAVEVGFQINDAIIAAKAKTVGHLFAISDDDIKKRQSSSAVDATQILKVAYDPRTLAIQEALKDPVKLKYEVPLGRPITALNAFNGKIPFGHSRAVHWIEFAFASSDTQNTFTSD
jgi:hypothetical protein